MGELLLREARRTFADRAVWLISSPEMRAQATRMGLRMDARRVEALLVMHAPELFRNALGSLGVIADEALMIGDNPATDIEGAARIPLRALRVNVATWDLQQPVAVQ